MEIKDRIKEVLEKTHLMSLGFVDKMGVWVSDLIFIYDDSLTIYWMSDPDSRHSKAIHEHPQVAGTITFTTKSKEPNFGIQFSGTAVKIEGPRYDLAVKHYAKRGRLAPSQDEDVLGGDAWYMLTPTHIDLIDEEYHGFKKQTLKL